MEKLNKSDYMDLYNDFPREMANPSRGIVVNSKKERNAYIRKFYKQKPIYISVYKFKEIIKGDPYKTHLTAVVDKMVFDFDDNDTYMNMIKFHNFLMKQNIMHRINLSGNGFHVYVAIEENLKYPKVAIANYWDFLSNRGIESKEEKYSNPFHRKINIESPCLDLCPSTRGDLGRIIRYPNTKNFKARCFCIPIDDYLLNLYHSLEEFQEFASKPYKAKGELTFGTKKLDLTLFDCSKQEYDDIGGFLTLTNVKIGNIEIKDDVEVDFDILPYCIKNMINNKPLHFKERNEVIKFFVNRSDISKPYTAGELLGILKKISKNNDWLRWFFNNGREWLLYRNIKVVMDNNQLRSGCRRIAMMGYCNRTKCNWKNITIRTEVEIEKDISDKLDEFFDDF